MNLWNAITQEARRWFNEELPGGLYAAGGMPPSVHATKALADVHRLSDLLPYETYDPAQGLFCNDDAVGFVIEITPATGLDDNQLRVLSGLFTQVMLPKTLLQISLYASPDIFPVLERWQSLRAQANPAFQFLAARRIDYLRTGNWQSLLSDQPMLLRNFRVFLTVSRPVMRTRTGGIGDVGWLQRLREAIKGMLASASLGVRDVDAQGFINLLDTILNPARERRMPIAWNESRLLREQMVDPDTLLLVGRDGLALSHRGFSVDVLPFSVRQYPQAWSGHGMINLIGDLYSNTLRIPCPFLYTLTVQMDDQAAASHQAKMKAVRATQMTDSPMGRFIPAWKERKQDWDFVTRMLEDGHRLLKSNFQIVLFAPQGEADHAEQQLTAVFNAKGWTIARDRFTTLHSLLTALPLTTGPRSGDELKVFGRLRTGVTWNCVNTGPFVGEWKGTGTPLLMLIGRRGQIQFIDPFDNKKGNFNVAVAAASGAGKSFFTQEMVTSLLATGGRCWVIDSGRSYERLCGMVGGTYLEFSDDTHVNLNPFSRIQDVTEEMSMLKAVLAQMAAPVQQLNSLQTAYLEEAIKWTWDSHGTDSTITHVANRLLDHADESATRVGRMLYPYTREGSYGRYFEGRANIDLDNAFVVLELGDLDSRPDLQTVVLLLLMLQITESMYLGDRKQRKLCIIDEAWRLMGSGNAGQFIEQGYRTARKFGGAFMTITQGIDDYFKSGTSKAALDNADWVFLLRQKPESIKAAESSDRIMMDDGLRRLLTSVDTQQGRYSEIAVMSPDGTSVGRLIVDPFAEKLYSTKAEEYAAIDTMLKRGHSLVDAIEQLVAANAEGR
jgi:conjugal transfer ATP-binding protein TraC